MYERGAGELKVDVAQALQNYRRAAEKGDQRAGVHASFLLKKQLDAQPLAEEAGDGTEGAGAVSLDEVHDLAQRSAAGGYAAGMSYFGLVLAAGWRGDGANTQQQHAQAANWMNQAAYREDVIAMTNLGVLAKVLCLFCALGLHILLQHCFAPGGVGAIAFPQ